MYGSMKSSTQVSAEDALADYTASRKDDGSKTSQRPNRDRRDRRKSSARKVDGPDPAGNSNTNGSPDEPTSTGSGAGKPEPSRTIAVAARRDDPGSRPSEGAIRAPRDGVYAWAIDGYEQAPGIRRDLPSRSHRVITLRGRNAWTEHHMFSEEREQWMDISVSSKGVEVSAVRNRVQMGPVEVDNTVNFDPPVFVARYPSKVGESWKGSWSGRTSGTYTARTFDHTTVVIKGEEVEVYASEVIMDMQGEVEGRVVTTSWYSLRYRMVVKQSQKMDVETGPGNYRSEWSGQVLSLDPRR